MKLQQAIDRVDEMRPNLTGRELKVAWLSELDGLVWRELILKHQMTQEEWNRYPHDEWNRPQMPVYDPDTDPGTELLVREPYDSLYVYWLMSRIDEQTMEWEKFNNDRAMFNGAYESFSDYLTRTHMPIGRIRELRI